MLSNPEHGWCNVKIGDFEGVASYLTDVPCNCLEAFIQYLSRGNHINSSSIFFDEEGTEFTVVLEYYSTYVIIERGIIPELKCYHDISIHMLAYELIDDLDRDFDRWVNWECYDNPKEGRSELLRSKINELKELINS